MTRVHKIVVVDDHPVVRAGLAQAFNAEPDLEVCGEAAGSPDAIELVRQHKPDLVLVDIVLESGSGIDLVKQIRAREESTKVLVISMYDDNIYAERALRAGAHGYVNKAEPPARIVEAIRQVLRGKIVLNPAMQNAVLQRFYDTSGTDPKSAIDSLSDRELEVLEHIGRGLTTREIAERMLLSPKTVETYREHIKMKLKIKNVTQLTRYAVIWAQGPSESSPPPPAP